MEGSWCIKGAIGIDVTKKKIVRFKCKSLILVSGGYTRVYEVSSSRIFENYGDGPISSYQNGLAKEALGMFATEAIRGEGVIAKF